MHSKIKKYLQNVNPMQMVLMLCLTSFFLIIMIFPLFSLFSKAFLSQNGDFVGFRNYIKYFSTPVLSISVFNTIHISLMTTLFSTMMGLCYAYALTRTNICYKRFFKYAALLPLFLPTTVHGLGLVYLFGNQGVLTNLGLHIELYGKVGIILAEIIYTFPQSFLMFMITLSYADGRLYEAADSMGCGAVKKIIKITIPEVKYTLISSAFVCFTLAFTDFGAPQVLGGSYNVLATDIYKQIAGQFNMNMGAVVGTLLLIPSIISFGVDRINSKKSGDDISAKATTLTVKPCKARDHVFFAFCSFVVISFLALIGVLVMGAFMKYYPYETAFTLDNFKFNASTGGIESYFNSLYMSFLTAVFGTIFAFGYAYLIEKGKGMLTLKRLGRLMSVLPIALPGMVIGLSFIFFFNSKSNPFNFIYGTIVILVMANILHFYSVSYVTATSALKKLDREFENVSESMRVPSWKTFFMVSVPMSLPAVLEIFMYYFVNSMVTVSAMVFLYAADLKVAAIAITHMEESGDFSQAAAMSLLILLVNISVRFLYEVILRALKNKNKKVNEEKINE